MSAGGNEEAMQFPEHVLNAIWGKGAPIAGHPEDIWRRDRNSHVINYQDYGNEASVYGWRVVSSKGNEESSIDDMHPLSYQSQP